MAKIIIPRLPAFYVLFLALSICSFHFVRNMDVACAGLTKRFHGGATTANYSWGNFRNFRANKNVSLTPQILPHAVILPIPRYNPYFNNVTRIDPNDQNSDHRGADLVVTNYPFSVVAPTSSLPLVLGVTTSVYGNRTFNYSRDLSKNCSKQPLLTLQKTSLQAKDHHCDIVASNGGPFDADGWTTGPTVVDGQLVRTKNSSLHDSYFVGLGTATTDSLNSDSSSHYWVLGSYHQITNDPSRTMTILSFVTGFQWLVYHGKNLADDSRNPTGADRAPRTAIGLDRDSNLMLLVVDGCEKWYVGS
jgi:hypothetical protein